MIFTGDIQPMMEGYPHADRTAIGEKVKSYGAMGEEILLRAETVAFFLSGQD